MAAVGGGTACNRGPSEQARARTASLEQALRPSFFAAAVRKMGGGHFRSVARFAVGPHGKGPDAVTTTTDVWLDRAGNYRVVESNDQDGGREVVLSGRELAVALRYGKMIRRIAEEPEPTRILEEALGAPWAAWEVIASATAIEPGKTQLVAGAKALEYRLAKGAAVTQKPQNLPRLRKWRGTVAVQQLDGYMLVDERSGALVKADMRASYTLTNDGRALYGTIDVKANLTEAAAVPPIQKPPSEELSFRQRIVPEQKELLGGLGGRVPPPVPEPVKPKGEEKVSDDPKTPGGNGSGNGSGKAPDPTSTRPELIMFPGSRLQEEAGALDHLSLHRRLIVRRSLLASAVGGLVPIPVMDDYLAGRIRAGLLMRLAERRQVDLAQSSADLLADPREETAVRNATLTAATLLALKLAWRKFFALLAVGRRAEDMATTFQMGTLFDHFCAKLHVGSGLDRPRALQLRVVIHAALAEAERGAVVSAFRDGGQILGRSLLEAPEWVSKRFEKATEQWMRGGAQAGQPIPYDDIEDISPENARWLDRASAAVESGLGRLGTTYLESLIRIFERRWRDAETARQKAEEAAKQKGDKSDPQTPTP